MDGQRRNAPGSAPAGVASVFLLLAGTAILQFVVITQQTQAIVGPGPGLATGEIAGILLLMANLSLLALAGFLVMDPYRDLERRLAAVHEENRAYRAKVEERTRALEERNEDLELSNQELEQFAHVASHDLQEPLRTVTSYLQLLQRRYEDQLDEEADVFIGYAIGGAQRMKRLIQGLLSYASVDSLERPDQTVDLDQVLDDVLTDLQLRIHETKASISRERLPAVHGDRSQLGQLLRHLLLNALRYTEDGQAPEIRIHAEPIATGWRLWVQDQGIGIDPNHQDRIFRIFQRLHPWQEEEGHGIGLAVCRKVAERHGGEIGVESQPGDGARFWVDLPGVQEDEVVSEPERNGAGMLGDVRFNELV